MNASKHQHKSLERLKERSDFLKMNKYAQRWVSHGLTIQALPNDLGKIRVGFTVTKRLEPSAVKRNRMKRRLRAIADEILPAHAKDSCDYVLIGRKLTPTRPYETLQNDLKWCLEKMGFTQ